MTTTESEKHEPGADKKPSNVQPELETLVAYRPLSTPNPISSTRALKRSKSTVLGYAEGRGLEGSAVLLALLGSGLPYLLQWWTCGGGLRWRMRR